jgi:microcystin-dependent protein
MPRYPEYQIHSLDTHGYGRIIQTIDGKFYDGWGNTVIFTLFGKEVSINVEGVGEDSTDGGNVNVTNTNNTDLFQDLQNQINDLKNKLNQQNTQLNQQLTTASYVLTGTIVMWGYSGIPAGWIICDGRVLDKNTYGDTSLYNQLKGQNYPFGGSGDNPQLLDLRERFIVGAGGDNNSVIGSGYNVGDKGGVNNNILTLKNIPEHEHKYYRNNGYTFAKSKVDPNSYGSYYEAVTTVTAATSGTDSTGNKGVDGDGGMWTPTIFSNYGTGPKKDGPGFKSITFNGDTVYIPNDPTPIENRPPYFALCYIIKL